MCRIYGRDVLDLIRRLLILFLVFLLIQNNTICTYLLRDLCVKIKSNENNSECYDTTRSDYYEVQRIFVFTF